MIISEEKAQKSVNRHHFEMPEPRPSATIKWLEKYRLELQDEYMRVLLIHADNYEEKREKNKFLNAIQDQLHETWFDLEILKKARNYE